MLSSYYKVTKPGIIRGNVIVTIAGYLFAAPSPFSVSTFLGLICGTSLIIAAGCVFNNVLDRDIDSKMKRTKKRPVVTGEIPKINALVYGAVLSIVGFWLLLAYTNKLTALIGLVGLLFYVVVYGIAKRKTINSTLIGTISGATPPVAGYAAATNTIDTAAILLFLVLVFWQMPHFYAIAIFRSKEYAAAHLPTAPLVKGIAYTKKLMLLYGVLFILATQLLAITGYMGIVYSIAMLIVALNWLRIIASPDITDTNAWAIKVFKVSLYTLLSFSVFISLKIVFV